MLEILKFTFSSFWVWAGMVILLMMACSVFCAFISFLAEVFRPRPPCRPDEPPVESSDD